MKKNKKLQISIVIAGIIVSGAIISSRDFSLRKDKNEEVLLPTMEISAVRETEPILGDPESSIIFIEYSDTECPFSKALSTVRATLMSLYGDKGEIAWVYRTLNVINETSYKKALALECVVEIEENHKFWNYLQKISDIEVIQNTNDSVNTNTLIEIAENEGLSVNKLLKCMNEERHKVKIENNNKEFLRAGLTTTPSIIMHLSKKLSPDQERKVNEALIDLPSDFVTIPPTSDKIFLRGLVPSDFAKEIINIILEK